MAANWLDDGHITATLAQLDGPKSAAKQIEEDVGDVKVPANLQPAADRISAAWTTATDEVRTQWAALPRPHQAVVGLAAIVGLAGGVVLGLAMPTWAAGAVTSLFGAAIWIPCLVWLSNAFGAPWRGQFDRTPAAWLAIWAVVAFIGMLAQWSGVLGGKKAKAKAAAPAAGREYGHEQGCRAGTHETLDARPVPMDGVQVRSPRIPSPRPGVRRARFGFVRRMFDARRPAWREHLAFRQPPTQA